MYVNVFMTLIQNPYRSQPQMYKHEQVCCCSDQKPCENVWVRRKCVCERIQFWECALVEQASLLNPIQNNRGNVLWRYLDNAGEAIQNACDSYKAACLRRNVPASPQQHQQLHTFMSTLHSARAQGFQVCSFHCYRRNLSCHWLLLVMCSTNSIHDHAIYCAQQAVTICL